MLRADFLNFKKIVLKKNGVRFYYLVDKKEYSFFTSFGERKITLDERQKYLVAANIGLSYLIDLAIISFPKKIIVETIKLNDDALNFWKETYEKLGMERVFKEKLPVSLLTCRWINEGKIISPSSTLKRGKNILLAMSGGKESLSALKIFEKKKATKNLTLFFLHYPDRNWYWGKKVYEKLKEKYPTIKIRSEITNLSKLSKFYGYKSKDYPQFVIGNIIFNALLYGDNFSYLIINNEYSSNFGNGIYHGKEVNHQYDKTIYFAKKVNRYIQKYLNKNFLYFSLFFGFYEYKITEIFFSNSKYLDIWTSCNECNSKFRFCTNCPKCAFTYLISLPFTSKEFLKRYFKKDLLKNLEIYRPLMDFKAQKPLDCVGEKKEVWMALFQLYKQKKELDSPVMIYFLKNIFPKIKKRMKLIERELEKEHTRLVYIPKGFKFLID